MTSRSKIPIWELPLVTLYDALSQEALAQPGKWACRSMVRGALVCAILEETGLESPLHARLVIRIARPTRAIEREKWDAEVQTFARFMQLTDPPWERIDEIDAKGVAVRFRERVELLREAEK